MLTTYMPNVSVPIDYFSTHPSLYSFTQHAAQHNLAHIDSDSVTAFGG